jgi:hypothetical protein
MLKDYQLECFGYELYDEFVGLSMDITLNHDKWNFSTALP